MRTVKIVPLKVTTVGSTFYRSIGRHFELALPRQVMVVEQFVTTPWLFTDWLVAILEARSVATRLKCSASKVIITMSSDFVAVRASEAIITEHCQALRGLLATTFVEELIMST